jgi:hypothetical protein
MLATLQMHASIVRGRNLCPPVLLRLLPTKTCMHDAEREKSCCLARENNKGYSHCSLALLRQITRTGPPYVPAPFLCLSFFLSPSLLEEYTHRHSPSLSLSPLMHHWRIFRLSATVTPKIFPLYHFFPLFFPLFFHLPQRFPLNTPPIPHYNYKISFFISNINFLSTNNYSWPHSTVL